MRANPKTGLNGGWRGFVLLEAILALALFATVAVGFTTAISRLSAAATSAGERMRIQRMLETLLTEASKAVEFEEGEEGLGPDGKGVYYTRVIEEMELENMDGQALQNMFRIAILAEWTDDLQTEHSRVAELIRYEPLYQNTQ
jgi:hypothetical protein